MNVNSLLVGLVTVLVTLMLIFVSIPCQAKVYSVFIEGEISQQMVDDVEDVTVEATKDDIIVFVIDTPGGRVDYSMLIYSAVLDSPAYKIGVVQDRAYSAGAFLLCFMDNLQINDSSAVLFHTVQNDSKPVTEERDEGDKELFKFISMTLEYCKPLVTQSDIESVKQGSDVVVKGSVINKRIGK